MSQVSEQLRVALVIGDLNVGGAQKQSYYMAVALQQAGADVRVYYTNNGAARFQQLRDMGVKTIWFGRSKGKLQRTVALWRLLREFRPHIAFATRTYNNLYLGVAGRLSGTPTVGTLRNSVPYEQADFGRLFPLLCRLPNAVAVNSYLAAEQLKRVPWMPAERVQVLLNVIDLGAFDEAAAVAPSLDVPTEQVPVMFVGRLVTQKRIPWLLAAFEQAQADAPNLHLYIVGEGEERQTIAAAIQDRGLTSAVTLLGQRGDVPALLKQVADVLVLSSEEEGFPNTVMEAMAAGKPVVSTRAGDAEKIILDGETGYLADTDDVAGFAAALVKIAQQPAHAEQLGQCGRERIESEFAAANFGQRILSMFYAVRPRLQAYTLSPGMSVDNMPSYSE